MSKKSDNNLIISGRVWAFVLYPDSCIDYVDMINKLERLCIPMAISPLHRPELNEKKQNELKYHYHCMMYFDGQKSEKQLKKLIDYETSKYDQKYFDWTLLVDKENLYNKHSAYPFFYKINNIRAYVRYLIHLDNPEKQQFNDYKICNFVSDDEQKYNTLVLLNGFNIKDYLTCLTVSPDRQILDIVNDNNFEQINQLIKYLVYNQNDFLLSYVKKNLNYIRTFLLPDLFFYGRSGRYTTTKATVED